MSFMDGLLLLVTGVVHSYSEKSLKMIFVMLIVDVVFVNLWLFTTNKWVKIIVAIILNIIAFIFHPLILLLLNQNAKQYFFSKYYNRFKDPCLPNGKNAVGIWHLPYGCYVYQLIYISVIIFCLILKFSNMNKCRNENTENTA